MSSELKESKRIEEDDLKVETCPICCDLYTTNTRKKISCNFCAYKCCISCYKKYCTSTLNEPHCMSCKKKWSREFLCSFFPKTFINNDYKKHQENLLLEREKSMMPSTQIYIEYKKQAEMYLKMAYEVQEKINALQDEYNSLMRLHNSNMNKYLNPKSFASEIKSDNERKKVTFTKPCPVDNCRGFINNRWNCGVCATKICNECHEIKRDEHKCDPSVVETIKLLKTDTKACPKCHTLIHKLEGCDQMWCTICKTAFSWNTGKIISGQVHNPHYFEYLRRLGREDEEIANRFGENPCNRRIDGVLNRINVLHRRRVGGGLDRFYPGTENFRNIYNMTQHLFHLENVEMPRYRNMEEQEMINVDLRIQYLDSLLTEEDLKIKIQRRNKKLMFNQNMMEVLQMHYDVMLDFLNELLIQLENNKEDWKDFFDRTKKLCEYTLENINKIKTVYNYKASLDHLVFGHTV